MKLKNWKHYLVAGALVLSAKAGTANATLAGVKATGMGGACTAYPIDCFAGAYNPAGITLLCNRFDIGASYTHYAQRVNFTDYVEPAFIDLNGSRGGGHFNPRYNAEFGINTDFNFQPGNCNVDVSVGLIGYNRSFIKTRYSDPLSIFGTTDVGMEYLHETIAPILAIRMDRHSLGIAFNIHFQRLKINGLENFATPAFSVDPAAVTNNGYDKSKGYGVTLGYMWEISRCLRFGMAWQPKQHMQRFKKYDGFIADNGKFDIPDRFQFGLAYSFNPCLTLAGDFEYVHWKSIRMLNNDPTFFSTLLGSECGPGFGWKNQYFWRFGVDYAINSCFNVRVGFQHVNSPIKQRNTLFNLMTLECVENLLTCGGTWSPDTRNELSFFCVMGMKKKVTGKNSIPAGFGGTQTETNSTDATLKQSLVSVGLSWGNKF